MSEGASIDEQLIGAARYNNDQLLEAALEGKSPEEIAKIINTLRDPVGNGLLHLAAKHGSLEALDVLLDQEGVEIDPKSRLTGSTPLHLAVEYATKFGNEEEGKAVVELLIEAGAQPDPRDNQGKRPIDLAKGNVPISNVIRGAQYAAEMEREAAAGVADGAEDLGAEDGEPDADDVDAVAPVDAAAAPPAPSAPPAPPAPAPEATKS